MKSIRLKTILFFTLISLGAISLMRLFHGIYVLYSWDYILSELTLFSIICGSLILTSSAALLIIGRPLDIGRKKLSTGEALDQKLQEKILSRLKSYPILVLIINILGFLLGPLANFGLKGYSLVETITILTTLYNVGIGMVAALLEIQVIHLIILPFTAMLQIRQIKAQHLKKALTNRSRTILTVLAVSFFVFFLTLAAGYGTLEEIRLGRTAPTGTEFLLRTAPLGMVIFLILALTITISTREHHLRLHLFRRRLEEMTEDEGDLTQRFNLIRFDDLGQLTSAMNGFLDKLQTLLQKIHRTTHRVSGTSIRLNSSADQTANSLEQLFGALESIDRTVKEQMPAAEQSREALESLNGAVKEVSDNLGSQAGYVEESSAAISQMVENIKSVAETTENARNISDQLESIAQEGGSTVENSTQAIQEASQTTSRVKDKVKLISQISAQTNLLSMNAAIEAAHAGHSGRGFAVVADEIRKLASSSSSGAGEINDLMKEMEGKIRRGVSLSNRTKEAFDNISRIIGRNTELIESIAASMAEQKTGTDEVLQSISELVNSTNTIKELMKNQDSRSREMEIAFRKLFDSFETIGTDVQEQLGKIDDLASVSTQLQSISEGNTSSVQELEDNVKKFKIS